MSTKRAKHTEKAGSPIARSAVSSEEGLTAPSMSFYTERISPDDTGKLWKRPKGCAKDVKLLTISVRSVSGITYGRPKEANGAIVYTRPCGFANLGTRSSM